MGLELVPRREQKTVVGGCSRLGVNSAEALA